MLSAPQDRDHTASRAEDRQGCCAARHRLEPFKDGSDHTVRVPRPQPGRSSVRGFPRWVFPSLTFSSSGCVMERTRPSANRWPGADHQQPWRAADSRAARLGGERVRVTARFSRRCPGPQAPRHARPATTGSYPEPVSAAAALSVMSLPPLPRPSAQQAGCGSPRPCAAAPRPVNDTWVAACCIAYDLPLATLNSAIQASAG